MEIAQSIAKALQDVPEEVMEDAYPTENVQEPDNETEGML